MYENVFFFCGTSGEVLCFLYGDSDGELEDGPWKSLELVVNGHCWLVGRDSLHHGEGGMTEIGCTSIACDLDGDKSAGIIIVGLVSLS